MSDMENLKKAWEGAGGAGWTYPRLDISKREKNSFDEWMNNHPLEPMQLADYTNLKKPEDEDYFTHWLERKTEACGKFRAASSYAYGVYRANVKDKSNIEPKYKSADQRLQKDSYYNEDEATKYFNEKIKPNLIKLSRFEDVENSESPLEINFSRKVAYMFNPGNLLPIFRNETIKVIAEYFDVEDLDVSDYKATEKILNRILEVWEIKKPEDERGRFELSQNLGNFLWEKFGRSFSLKNKNIIFYGAPGTGKTYTVMEGVRQQVSLKKTELDEVLELAQFHPSYSYEDFIEGLKPVFVKDAISLKLQPGRFKQLCKKAAAKLKVEREDGRKDEDLTKFYFVADEINRAELSRVLGEVLVCLEESKRIDFDKTGKLTNDSLYVKTQYGHLDNSEDAVLTINGEYYFGVPVNLYFIGTMNDIDRSIDSFDLALRRRFTWIESRCDYSVIEDALLERNNDHNSIELYKELCESLNKKISKEWRLGTSYEIGHSYFMKVGKISQTSVSELFDMSISPLLKEYLRAEYNVLEIEAKLKEARSQFSWGKKASLQTAG